MLQKLSLLLAQKLGFSTTQKLTFFNPEYFNVARSECLMSLKYEPLKNDLCNVKKTFFLVSQKCVLMSQ